MNADPAQEATPSPQEDADAPSDDETTDPDPNPVEPLVPPDPSSPPEGNGDLEGPGSGMNPQPTEAPVAPDPVAPEVVEPEVANPEVTDPEVVEPEPMNPGIIEPVTEEDYHVRNLTADELTVLAMAFANDPVELIEETVPAGEQVHIYHAVEGTGGHAMPSNFFGDFQVLSGNAIVYQGVVNDDWQEEELGLVLVIEAEVAVPQAEAADYSCGAASDCEIKDVGNCCGYYPRCVNVDSPTPAPECADGAGGVCGWPDITHCECVENTCRSMQGDTEI